MARSNRKKLATDPKAIFHHAESFFGVIDQLHKTSSPERYKRIQAPVIALSAFASELYLKCLICSETGTAPSGHSLFLLFKKLSSKSRDAIDTHWQDIVRARESDILKLEKKMGNPVPRSLEDTLEHSANSYEEVRYLYQEPPNYYSAIGDLPLALRLAIKDLQPSWLPTGYFTPPS